jgi:alpha-amylase/alpha-mannosidase (GH57 family)
MERKGSVSEEVWNKAYEELLVSEGSDWMWWFGNDFTSDQDEIFDSLFRRHIGNIYNLIGLAEPDGLQNPIKKSLGGRTSVMV